MCCRAYKRELFLIVGQLISYKNRRMLCNHLLTGGTLCWNTEEGNKSLGHKEAHASGQNGGLGTIPASNAQSLGAKSIWWLLHVCQPNVSWAAVCDSGTQFCCQK